MEFLTYLNGRLVPKEDARISIWDIGFTCSAVFIEASRTFRHKLFRLEDHLERMEKSMRYAGLAPLVSTEAMGHIVAETIEANIDQFEEDNDCWVCWQITPGSGFPHPMMKVDGKNRPTIMAYVSPLPFDEYYAGYSKGIPAEVPSVRNVPPCVVDPRAKTRYRLHCFTANLEAKARDADAFALLLDTDNFISEGTGANFFIAKKGVLHTPTTRNVLEGVSRRTVMELASGLGIRVVERDIPLSDVDGADEAFWTTSSYCMLPCSRVGQMPVKTCPGPLYKRIIDAWSKEIGVDIIGQARKYHERRSNIWKENSSP